jgi:hypothetical protein
MIVTALTKPWRNLGEPTVEVIGVGRLYSS